MLVRGVYWLGEGGDRRYRVPLLTHITASAIRQGAAQWGRSGCPPYIIPGISSYMLLLAFSGLRAFPRTTRVLHMPNSN